MKRLTSIFLAAVLLLSIVTGLPFAASAETADELKHTAPGGGAAVNAAGVDPTEYTYEVIPLLEPFNVYFFVKTENPDPHSFRFADHDSVYSEEGKPGLIELYDSNSRNRQFADVVYENPETMRVKGGYIFWSGYTDTDGGKLTLQTPSYNYWGRIEEWKDSDMTLTIPALCDDIDYLIDTYSKGDGFFENMDAIQAGLSTICLYSDNYIRGNLVRKQSYWYMYRSPHIYQTYYIGSPSSRQENRYLFASSLYPLVRDSLGFPSTMAAVARRLDETAVCEWSSSSHAFIKVTYNGETRTYGGQGNGMGQGISEDKITKFFTFGDDDMGITLDSLKKLHAEYASIVMENDVYHDDELTWKAVNDTVDKGAWVYFTNGYTYLYKKDDKDNYSTMAAGSAGGSLYWGGGSLGYLTNAWIDGRHISKWSMLDPGATFEQYPTDAIALTDAVVPVFTYKRSGSYNWSTGTYTYVYSDVTVTEYTGLLRYSYNATDNTWDVPVQSSYNYEDGTYSDSGYATAVILAENGLIDEKYVDMLRLTYDQVLEMDVDRNTDLAPEHGLVYNGNAAPGTPFDATLLDVEDPSVLFADAKAIAEENGLEFSLEEGNYGICGNPVYWVYLEDSQTLIITGTGPMFTLEQSPWYHGARPVKDLIIGEGIEVLPDQAFYFCSKLETVSLPTTLKKIGWDAFFYCNGLTAIEIPASVESMGGSVFDWCRTLTDIYCLADSQPEGWQIDWLGDCEATVHWGTAKPCGHKNTTTTRKEATCTEAGYEETVCNKCGDRIFYQEFPATGHSFGEWKVTKAHTCTEDGTEERICGSCGMKETRTLSATGHSFGEWTVTKAPTCTEDGTEERTCDSCDAKETRVLSAAGHAWEDHPTVVAPTCTKDGSTAVHCKNCDATKDAAVLPATGHSFGEWKTAKAPTCTEDGTEERTCGSCGTKETRTLLATGHNYLDGVCTACGAKEKSLLPGDLNGDGLIDTLDYMMLKRAVLGTFTLNDEQKAAADVNRDHDIDALDYMMVKRHVMGTFKIA